MRLLFAPKTVPERGRHRGGVPERETALVLGCGSAVNSGERLRWRECGQRQDGGGNQFVKIS